MVHRGSGRVAYYLYVTSTVCVIVLRFPFGTSAALLFISPYVSRFRFRSPLKPKGKYFDSMRSGTNTLYCSIANGGLRHVDWMGKSSGRQFTFFTCREVQRFMKFDTYSCNLVVLQQGAKGVPIGGFLLAQLAEIWVMRKESTLLFGDQRN